MDTKNHHRHVSNCIEDNQQQAKRNTIILTIFILVIVGFLALIYNRPPFPESKVFQQVTFMPSTKHLYELSQVLVQYQSENYIFSLTVFIYLYTLLQAFAIPGSIFLCVISPALYGPVGAYFLVLSCSCLGASLCYFLSKTVARSLVLSKFPVLFTKFNGMVNAHRQNLFWYMLFLRLTPLIPNWFVNLGSPLVGMPYIYFLVATFFGLMPNTFVKIQTGMTLNEIDKLGLSPKSFVTLVFIGFLALIPTFWKEKYEKVPQDQLISSQKNCDI